MRIERQRIEIDGQTVAWAGGGEGPAVVLLHGTLTSLNDPLMALGPALVQAGFRVIAFDRPGNGESTRLPGEASMWGQAERLRDAARRLELKQPVLVGHSQGGSIATAWALAHPEEVAGVVAVAPIVVPEPRLELLIFGPRAPWGAGDLLSYAAMPLDGLLLPLLWRGMFLPQAMPAAFRATYPVDEAGERARLRAVAEETAHLVSDLGRLTASAAGCRVPVRVLQGDRDPVVNLLHGRTLAALAPDSSFTMLSGLGHMADHFAQKQVIAAVREIADPGQTRGCAAA